MNLAVPTDTLWPMRHGVSIPLPAMARIGLSAAMYGEWLQAELDLLGTLVESGQRIFEFGGDYGVQSIGWSQAVGPTGQVHVFEPRRLHLQVVNANLALNDITNTLVLPFWLGATPAPLMLAHGDIDHDLGGEERVDARRLDDLGLPPPHLVKVNFPGALGALLEGAWALVQRSRPIFYFRLGETPGQALPAITTLKSLGYRCWSHPAYLYNRHNHAGNRTNAFPGWVSRNVLAAPIERRLGFHRLMDI